MSAASPEARFFPEREFGGFTRRDGTVAFYGRVHALLQPHYRVLDVGCGRGEYAADAVGYRRELRTLKPRCARLIGLDPDPAAAANPFLHEFLQLSGPRWPLEDASIDFCLADWVLEHVDEPATFFSECARVLRPGGLFAARTSNRSSLLGLGSLVLPNRVHASVLRRTRSGRKAADVFPTRLRCNRRRTLQRLLAEHGLRGAVVFHRGEPTYLHHPRWAYLLELSLLNLAPSQWSYSLFVFARKLDPRPAAPEGGF